MNYDSPTIFQNFPNVIAAQSTRTGGYSQGEYHTLNLGLNTKDDIGIIQKNRASFFQSLGFSIDRVADSHQVHGIGIYRVMSPVSLYGYDALISDQPNILLSVTIADCVPILIYDPVNNAIAAVHSGWKGTAHKITTATIKTMAEEFGTKAKDCLAYIGTSICEKTFEVDQDVAQYFEADYKYWDKDRKKYLIDLKSHNRAQLLSLGVPPKNIETSPMSTVLHNDRYFSYRKEKGKTGRMLAVIGIKK